MSEARTLRRGEAVALTSLPAPRRRAGELVVSVAADGAAPDVVALLLGPDGRVGSDRDLVFFNQPRSADGAVAVDPAGARIRTGSVEERVARVLIGCAGDALDTGRPSSLRVDVAHPGGGVLATAVVDVPAHHRAETVLEVYRWGDGWKLRLLGEGYADGLAGLVRDHGVQVDEPGPTPTSSTPAPASAGPSPFAPAPTFPASTSTFPAPTSAPAPAGPSSFAPAPAPAVWTPPPARSPASPSRVGRSRSPHRRRTFAFVGAGAAALVTVVLGATLASGSASAPTRSAAAGPPAASSSAAPAASSTAASSATASATPLAAASSAAVPAASAAQAELALLPVKGRAPMTGYDRAQFGQAWADVDRNGCDTRNDVLRRDVSDAVIDPDTHGCVVLAGSVADPYSGTTIPFTRGADSSADVQIDHVVALGDAWQTGAQQLDATRREQFANDPLNLRAVDGGLNAQKGDGDAATWLPPNTTFRCSYVTLQVQVKRVYGLWVTPAEHDAIARVLAGCPGATPLPTPTSAATTTAAAPPPAVDPGDVYYANCTEAKAAGAAPILRGEPGYRAGLDRDDDGIACET